jgi:glycerol-3-phosphate acyltransferase PlsX
MNIVLDAMGSDNHPEPEIIAAVEAVKLFGDEIILVGHEEQITPRVNALAGDNQGVKIVHAAESVTMTDNPAANARRKSDNSMAVGMELVKSGVADAFVTAGNTGGAMANALFRLGRIRGVKRPALTVLLPVHNGHCAVLDIGANADCKPEYLVQFAHLGAVYTDKVLKKQNPRIGLLSNGEEAGKGNDLVKHTFPLLQKSGLNFIGNVESKELFGGLADVVVTDGFTGNVLLKTSEAVGKMITEMIRVELTSSMITKVGALLAKPAFAKVKKLMDPSEVGAAPLLGVDGLVFVGHGRSDNRALVSAIGVARQAVEADLLSALKVSIRTALS